MVLILTGACTGEDSGPPQAEAAIPPECVTTARQGIEILDLGAQMVGTKASSYGAFSDLVDANQRSGMACFGKVLPPGQFPPETPEEEAAFKASLRSPANACSDVSYSGSAGWSLWAMFHDSSIGWAKQGLWNRTVNGVRRDIETAAAAWPKCFPGEPLPRNLSLNSPWRFMDRVTYWLLLDLPQTLDMAPGSLLQGGDGGIYSP